MTQTSIILSQLKEISNVSGVEYLKLSNSFPILIRELDTNKSGLATNSINEFPEIKLKLEESIIKKNILRKTNLEFLNKLKLKNNNILKAFSEKIYLLDEVQNIILGIKEQSEEMEVISLNAMVVSIKSGKEGQAFSYITSNLKQTSLRLISQSNTLIEHSRKVQESIRKLQEEIQELFIAVGTPMSVDGSADLHYVLQVAKTIGSHLNDYCLVVTKSTVPVGTSALVRGAIQEQIGGAHV